MGVMAILGTGNRGVRKSRGQVLYVDTLPGKNITMRPPQQAVQSNMVYQPREVFLVSTRIAARQISANR